MRAGLGEEGESKTNDEIQTYVTKVLKEATYLKIHRVYGRDDESTHVMCGERRGARSSLRSR